MKYKKFLVTGSLGQLSREVQGILSVRNIDFIAPSEKVWDITDFKKTKEIINEVKPDIIINCAAYNLVDEAEGNPELADL
ncbi:MAG: sugar nucleotide-binding protein, partial [Candidatus Omnitrophica bacterium]|nr:sugar nucleotide-binding protein [Candidatus Omnitrophota bacterium]